MSNTLLYRSSIVTLVLGVAITLSNITSVFNAQLIETGKGSTVPTQGLHGAAVALAAQDANVGWNLGVGILLLMIGGFLHALYVLRDERPVRITVRKKKPVATQWFLMSVNV